MARVLPGRGGPSDLDCCVDIDGSVIDTVPSIDLAPSVVVSCTPLVVHDAGVVGELRIVQTRSQ